MDINETKDSDKKDSDKKFFNIDYIPDAKDYAAIYARKSTLIDSNSIEGQVEKAKKQLIEKKLLLYNVYTDEESATKFHPIHRPGFKQLLLDAYQKKFKTLIVFKRDRLARRVEDMIEIKNIFRKLNIKIIYAGEGNFEGSDDYINKFVDSIITSVAELEPSILTQRIASGKKEKRERGIKDGIAPWGYCKINDTYKVKDDYKSIFKIIFSIANKPIINNELLDSILILVNNELKTIDNKIINFTKLKQIISDPIYYGYMTKVASFIVSDSISNDDTDTPFVDIETHFVKCINVKRVFSSDIYFNKILLQVSNPTLKQRERIKEDSKNYLLKNLAFCKKCTSKLFLQSNNYQCINHCTSINKIELEITILKQLINDIRMQDFKKVVEDKISILKINVKEIEKQITTAKNNKNKIMHDIIEDCSLDSNKMKDMEEVVTLERKLYEDKKYISIREGILLNLILEDEIKDILKNINPLDLLDKFNKNIDYSTFILSGLIKKITVDGAKEASHEFENSIQYYK